MPTDEESVPVGRPLRLLVVEDNPLHAQALRLGLRRLGYTVLGVAATADEARRLFRAEPPDLLVLDIQLALDDHDDQDHDLDTDGIALAAELRQLHPTPLIFLTSLADDATFRRARQVAPAAFLLKPFDPDTVRRAIELAVVQAAGTIGPSDVAPADALDPATLGPLTDTLYVRHAGRFEVVRLPDIIYLAADRGYCDLHLLTGARYTLHTPLSDVEARLPAAGFTRVHRSYVVAWAAVEAVDPTTMEVRLRGGIRLPLSRTHREDLLRALPHLG